MKRPICPCTGRTDIQCDATGCDLALPPNSEPTRCHLCWLYHNDPSYHSLWGGPGLPFRPEWVSTSRLAADSVRLASLLPPDLSAVAGIPRSGVIPAAIIAAHLHLPLWELPPGGGLRPLGHGRGFVPERGWRVAVIDDTVYSGGAISRARERMEDRPAVYAAVYVTPAASGTVDYFAHTLAVPHLLEWNLFNNHGWAVASDFDGVLTIDGTDKPWLLPRARIIPLIATGRHEWHRQVTEDWLRLWGVRWERLEMLPNDQPTTTERIAEHKAHHYSTSECHAFVESDPVQAEIIHKLSKRFVICPTTGQLW